MKIYALLLLVYILLSLLWFLVYFLRPVMIGWLCRRAAARRDWQRLEDILKFAVNEGWIKKTDLEKLDKLIPIAHLTDEDPNGGCDGSDEYA